jgi:hypothetical protein
MRFQVLTAASMKVADFWDVAPCSLVETDCHVRGAYCLLIMEAVSIFVTGQFVGDYMAQHPRRQSSSVKNLWVPYLEPKCTSSGSNL